MSVLESLNHISYLLFRVFMNKITFSLQSVINLTVLFNLAKNCLETKLGEFKSDQKNVPNKSENPESLTK